MFHVHLEGPAFCLVWRRQHCLLKVALSRDVTAHVLTFRGEKRPGCGSFLLLFMGSWAPSESVFHSEVPGSLRPRGPRVILGELLCRVCSCGWLTLVQAAERVLWASG